MKQYCESAMNAGAKGVKIICAGRLAGSEMARKETQKLGSIPLHTLDANVDYAVTTARTTYGAIGIKVWIYKGKFGEETTSQGLHRRRRRPPRRIGPMDRSRENASTEQATGKKVSSGDQGAGSAEPSGASSSQSSEAGQSS